MIVNVILTICIVFKIMFFMRINTNLGLLVELVKRVMKDMFSFTVFLFVWIGAFTFLYILLGSYDTVGKKEHISPVVMHLIQTFENTVGNIKDPRYQFWLDNLKDHEGVSQFTIYVIWVVWFMNQFFLLIVLLNFLIAVIS